MITYKIIDKKGEDFYLDMNKKELESELFKKIWETFEFQSVEPYVDEGFNLKEVMSEENDSNYNNDNWGDNGIS